MKLIPAFLDFESFWSKTHSLSKMSPLEYVMHPETELQMLSAKFGKGYTDVIVGEDNIRHAVSKIDWSDKFVIGHNMSGFDALILAWRLGVRPAMWGCTLAMARPIFGKTVGLSLAKLVEHFEIGHKNQQALLDTQGKKLADFTADELRRMEVYSHDDTDQLYKLFYKLLPYYTRAELWHIDAKIRALVEPKLVLDMPMLRSALSDEVRDRYDNTLALAKMLDIDGHAIDISDEEAAVEVVRSQLASAPKFSALLEKMGVDTPMKKSPKTKKMIPALAKTDEGMLDLLEHPDSLVAAAAQARLAEKSTILESRLGSFIRAGEVTGGKWPVTTHYCGADTTGRASGWLYNPLNMTRVDPRNPRRSDALRKSIRAPKGYKVVVVDSSGIEMRFNHFLWKVPYSTKLWTENPKADLYRASAAKMYVIAPEAVSDDQRRFHKVLNLACVGASTLVLTSRGLVPIINVLATDLVWDGDQWVTHQGVLSQGVRQTQTAYGLTATPDHEILTEHGWQTWHAVHTSRSLFQSALSLANSQSLGGRPSCEMASRKDTTPSCSARAATATVLTGITSYMEGQPGAVSVPAELEQKHECRTPDTPTLSQTPHTAGDYSTESARQSHDATDPTQIQTMAEEGYLSMLTGLSTSLSSSDTLSDLPDGITQISTSTELTTTGGTSQETYGSAQDNRTPSIAGKPGNSHAESSSLNENSPTYDLLNCGPNNRYTVWTDHGPVIVHNCGYGMGPPKFRTQARTQGGVDLPVVFRFPDGSDRKVYGDRNIAKCIELEYPVVADEAKDGVYGWRRVNKEIPQGWDHCVEMLSYIASGREVAIDPWGLFHTCAEGIRLPSGRLIRYPDLRQEREYQEGDTEGDPTGPLQWVYGHGRHKAKLYGGKVDENIVQAGARDVVYDIALEVFKATGLYYSHEVYDELVYVVPDSEAEAFLALVQEEFRRPTKWFPELIKWSEGDIADSYGDAK